MLLNQCEESLKKGHLLSIPAVAFLSNRDIIGAPEHPTHTF